MKHDIKLTQPACWLLSILLSNPGWAKTEGDQYRGSKIAFSVLPELNTPVEIEKAPSQREMKKINPTWVETVVSFNLTDRGRDTVKLCIKSYIEKGALASGIYTLELMDTFGLAVEDEKE